MPRGFGQACLPCKQARSACSKTANLEEETCERCIRGNRDCAMPPPRPSDVTRSLDVIASDVPRPPPVISARAPGMACSACRKLRTSCSAVSNPEKIPCDRCARTQKDCIITAPTASERERAKRRISTIPTTSDDEPAARRNRPYDYSPYDDEDSVFQESIPKTETSQVDSSRIQYTPLINDTTLPVHPQYESLSRFPAVHQPSSAEVPQPRVSTPATLVNQRQSSTNEHGYASTMQSRYSPSQPPQVVSNHFTPITVPEAVADVPRDSQDGGRRILGTVELDARDTHDIFKHFNELYAPQLPLPIFEVPLSPDQYFQRCPLLFWSMVSVACRTWPNNPYHYAALSDPVKSMALQSISDRSLDVVQALLILLTWPLKEEIAADSNLPLAGAMILMARRAGIHRPAHGSDFVRARGNLTHRDVVSRTILWSYCLITYRNICSSKGHEPAAFYDSRQNDLDGYKRHMPAHLVFKLDVSDCLHDCLISMVKYGIEDITDDRVHGYKHLLGIYEDRMSAIYTSRTQELSRQDLIFYKAHQLVVLGLYFHLGIKHAHWEAFNRLAQAACHAADEINAFIQEDMKNALRLPIIMVWTLLYAGTGLLRLLRSTLASSFDVPRLESCMYTVIAAMDQLSRRDNKMTARLTLMMTQLVNSKRAFRTATGEPDTNLRIRTRLNASSVFDTSQRWREEFESADKVPARAAYLESANGGVAGPAEMHGAGEDDLGWMFLDFDIPLDMGLAQESSVLL